MRNPAVHIITLNWNGLADTLECLASLQALNYPNVTIHVVDNGSAGEDVQVIANRFPDVDLMAQKENTGFCRGNNLAMAKALDEGADFVILLNNDTLVEPTFVEELLGSSARLKGVGAVSPVICEHADPDRVCFSRATWEPSRAQFRLCEPGQQYGSLCNAQPYESEFACGCCMMVSADVVRQVGPLDERYFAYYDEADWCARMARQGLRSFVIPSARIYHKVSHPTPRPVSTYLLARNRLMWMEENLPTRVRVKSAPYLCREVIWHLCNAAGLKLRSHTLYSPRHSRALVAGWRDYLVGRRGKWGAETEALILPGTPMPIP